MIYNYVFMLILISYQIWLYFCSIISLYFCGIYCKDYVWEFDEDSVKMKNLWLACNWLISANPQKATWEVHARIWRVSLPGWISWVTSRLRPSRKWPAKLSTWSLFSVLFLIPLPTLYRPSLPTKVYEKQGVFSRNFWEIKP